MNNLGDQVYNLQMQNLVTLWEIDFSETITDIDGQKIYITSYKNNDGTNVMFNGQSYNFVGVSSGGFRSELNGQLPEPEMTFDKLSLNSLPSYATMKTAYTTQTGNVFFDWRGARITRIRTTSNHLDNGSNPDTTIHDSQDFYVDQITRTTSSTIAIKLTVSIGADRLTNQSVQELGFNRCSLRYRTHDGTDVSYLAENAGGCPYGNPTTKNDWSAVPDFGNLYFDETDAEETEPENDVCSYTVKGCQLRFDPGEIGLTLPFVGKYKSTGNDSSGGGESI